MDQLCLRGSIVVLLLSVVLSGCGGCGNSADGPGLVFAPEPGTFAVAPVDPATRGLPSSVPIGDLDGDGRPDLAVANYFSNTVSALLNNGVDGFAIAVDYDTGLTPESVALGDLDGDGYLDMAVANGGSDNVSFFLNKGND